MRFLRLPMSMRSASKSAEQIDSKKSVQDSRNSANSSEDQLTALHDEVLAQELALGSLDAMSSLAQNAMQAQANERWHRGHWEMWKERAKRFGVNMVDKASGKSSDEMQLTSRVNSPENHYHYVRNGLLSDLAKLAIAAALGAGGLAVWSWYNSGTKPPEQVKPVLDPGGLKIDVERPEK